MQSLSDFSLKQHKKLIGKKLTQSCSWDFPDFTRKNFLLMGNLSLLIMHIFNMNKDLYGM